MSSLPSWLRHYIGISWLEHGRDRAGADCWGLLYVIYRERFGIELPRYDSGYEGAGEADVADIARLIAGGGADWVEVEWGKERLGDGLLIRQLGQPCHVAMVAAPGVMLHIEEGTDSHRDDYDGPRWRPRIVAIYRHRSLAGAGDAVDGADSGAERGGDVVELHGVERREAARTALEPDRDWPVPGSRDLHRDGLERPHCRQLSSDPRRDERARGHRQLASNNGGRSVGNDGVARIRR